MNWKFWTWVSWKCRITPERMEEICKALEAYVREYGELVYGRSPSKGPRRALAPMMWRFPKEIGISAYEQRMFRIGVTPDMVERIRSAQNPVIEAKEARRAVNIAKMNEERKARGLPPI